MHVRISRARRDQATCQDLGHTPRIWLCCPFQNSDPGGFRAAGMGRRRCRLCGWQSGGAETSVVGRYLCRDPCGSPSGFECGDSGRSYWPYRASRARYGRQTATALAVLPGEPPTHARTRCRRPPFDVRRCKICAIRRGGGCDAALAQCRWPQGFMLGAAQRGKPYPSRIFSPQQA